MIGSLNDFRRQTFNFFCILLYSDYNCCLNERKDAMLTLILDTSTSIPFIALTKNHHLIDLLELPQKQQYSEYLFLSIRNLLEKQELELSNLERIAVGTGPGFYTGMRVGIATAKSFAFSLQIPLISFCSLSAFFPKQFGKFAILSDGKQKTAYVLKGEHTESGKQLSSDLKRVDLDQLPQELSDCSTILPLPNASFENSLAQHLPYGKWLQCQPHLDLNALLIQFNQGFEQFEPVYSEL